MALHQLNRFSSSPSLNTTPTNSQFGTNNNSLHNGNGNNNNNNNYNNNNNHNHHTLTPKTSYDSLGSFRSFGTTSSSVVGGGPWSMYGATSNGLNAQQQSFDLKSSRHNSIAYSSSDGYLDLFNSSGPIGNNIKLGSGSSADSFSEDRKKMSFSLESIDPLVNLDLTKAIAKNTNRNSTSKFNYFMGGAGATAGSTQTFNVDPAAEQAFRSMAKSLEDKENQIAELKLQVEALLAASAMTGSGIANAAKVQTLDGASTNMDCQEMAHRILVRIKNLKQENESLGVRITLPFFYQSQAIVCPNNYMVCRKCCLMVVQPKRK